MKRLWKCLILFLVESVCDDAKLNEAIDEIANSKRVSESDIIFRIRENEMMHYTYIKSQVTLLKVTSGFDFSKQKTGDGVVLFPDYNGL